MDKFLKTITHPNRYALAEKLIAGVSSEELEELYAEFGKTRVQEMQNAIIAFNSMPVATRKRAIENAGCRMCRRNPGTCTV